MCCRQGSGDVHLRTNRRRRYRRFTCVQYYVCNSFLWWLQQWPEEYADVLEGRGRHERDDSITLTILEERKRHQERYNAILNNTDTYQLAARLEDRGFGSKTRIKGVYEPFATAAGGFGTHLASVTNNFPVFKHLLPEIAFAGHSNSGKSTLVNALIGTYVGCKGFIVRTLF